MFLIVSTGLANDEWTDWHCRALQPKVTPLSAERWNVPVDRRVDFVEGSVADDATVEAIGDEYDFIFHLCTYHGNQSSIHDPLADHEHNQMTTLKLFERVKDHRRLRKMVYSGAGCAVAEKTHGKAVATLEDGPVHLDMDSPYSISKLVGEMYALYYARRHRTPNRANQSPLGPTRRPWAQMAARRRSSTSFRPGRRSLPIRPATRL
jgi:nucleoside-diphosphate-sugar epimerase